MGKKSLVRPLNASVLLLALPLLGRSENVFTQGTSEAPQRRALIVGNQRYSVGALANPINDALAMRRQLEQLGFEVQVATDRPRALMIADIENWTEGLPQNSVALFYFAGHGFEIEGTNYLVPIDFQYVTEEEARVNSISVDWVRERLERSGSVLRLLILDACRNNPFRRSRGGTTGLVSMQAAEGTFIASATGPGLIAADGIGDQRNGLFTAYLLDGLTREGLELNELFTNVRLQVIEATRRRQNPWVNTGVIGKFYFRPPPGWSDPRFQRSAPKAGTTGESGRGPGGLSREQIDCRDHHLKLGRSLFLSGKVREATAELQLSLECDAQSVESLNLLARSQIGQGMFEAAIVNLTRAIQVSPMSADMLKLRGQAYCEAARYREAVEDLSRAIELAPDAGSFWWRRTARLRLGDVVGAEADARSQRELSKSGKSAGPPAKR